MFCKFCGEKIEKDAVFCSKCGKQIKENKAESKIDISEISISSTPKEGARKKTIKILKKCCFWGV